jgi:hypothetical protein
VSKRPYGVGACITVLILCVSACSGSGGKQAYASTTTGATTTSGVAHGTRSASTFEVVQELSRTSPEERCHTLPTSLSCLKVGSTIGTGLDVRGARIAASKFPQRWDIVIDVDVAMRTAINRHLHRHLAFVIDGRTVFTVEDFLQPVTSTVLTVPVETDKAAASTLVTRILAARS